VYCEIVSEYCTRGPSCQSDALNAVGGILAHLTESGLFPGGFFWGLPREDLFNGLLWLREDEARPRPEGFPSWS